MKVQSSNVRLRDTSRSSRTITTFLFRNQVLLKSRGYFGISRNLRIVKRIPRTHRAYLTVSQAVSQFCHSVVDTKWIVEDVGQRDDSFERNSSKLFDHDSTIAEMKNDDAQSWSFNHDRSYTTESSNTPIQTNIRRNFERKIRLPIDFSKLSSSNETKFDRRSINRVRDD